MQFVIREHIEAAAQVLAFCLPTWPDHTLISDDVWRRSQKARQDARDNELIFYLLNETTHLPRDLDLPSYMKRKALLWMKEKRPEWTEQDKLDAYSNAIPYVLDGSKSDAFLRRWMGVKRQDLMVARMNKHYDGMYVPEKGFIARFFDTIGMHRTADRRQIASAYRVLPKPE